MRLETESGLVIENPTDEQIRDALAGLNGQEYGRNTFATLTRGDNPLAYMQTAGGPKEFTIEYREGEKQYGTPDDVAYENAVRLFESYNRNDEAWRTMVEWPELIEQTREPIWTKVLAVAVTLLVLVAIVLLYLSTR
jgi:hypothetical protein